MYCCVVWGQVVCLWRVFFGGGGSSASTTATALSPARASETKSAGEVTRSFPHQCLPASPVKDTVA